MSKHESDVDILQKILADLPIDWDGRRAICEMKGREFQWRQMEWAGFYFEMLCCDRISGNFAIPGAKYGNVEFDCARDINWDMKASAIKTDRHVAILNDIDATNASVCENGRHGIVMALIDVEYNDEDRTFQRWHSELKGGVSEYEQDRIRRNATSRYRKTSAKLRQVLFLEITKDNLKHLGMHSQGRNSNGSPRNPKYQMNIEDTRQFEVDRIDFS